MVIGAEVDEEAVHRVEDFLWASVGAVDLVQRHDHRKVAGHRLLEDIPGLGKWSLGRIHQQQHGVDHEERSLDLAAEVGVAGRVDDVQAGAVVVHRRLLGEDRDPLLALEVAGVEHAIDDRLVAAERAGLAQHPVHERGLAVVDVGDDRDVAQVGPDRERSSGHGSDASRSPGRRHLPTAGWPTDHSLGSQRGATKRRGSWSIATRPLPSRATVINLPAAASYATR